MQFKKHTALKQVCVCGVFIAISIIGSNLIFRRQQAPATGNPPIISKSAYRVNYSGIRQQVATTHKSSSVDNVDYNAPSGFKYKPKTKWLVDPSPSGILPILHFTSVSASLNKIISTRSYIMRPAYYVNLFRYALF